MRPREGGHRHGKRGPTVEVNGIPIAPVETDFEIAIESGTRLPHVLGEQQPLGPGFGLPEYNAWQWYIARNPMRGYRGSHYLGAKRIAQAASSPENIVSAYDVMWWHDIDALLAEHEAILQELPESIRRAPHAERQAYIKARKAREPGWLI